MNLICQILLTFQIGTFSERKTLKFKTHINIKKYHFFIYFFPKGESFYLDISLGRIVRLLSLQSHVWLTHLILQFQYVSVDFVVLILVCAARDFTTTSNTSTSITARALAILRIPATFYHSNVNFTNSLSNNITTKLNIRTIFCLIFSCRKLFYWRYF